MRRTLERDRTPEEVEQLVHLGTRETGGHAQLVRVRFDAVPVDPLSARLAKAPKPVVLVAGNSDRAALLLEGTMDRLSDPPVGVGDELDVPPRVEPQGSLDQPEVPRCYQFVARQASSHEVPGDYGNVGQGPLDVTDQRVTVLT
jgi:hypothetical protein